MTDLNSIATRAGKIKDAIEIEKCKQSFVYFVETYCKIKDEVSGIKKFKLWECQHELVHHLLEDKKLIFLKSRQIGASWLSGGAYVLWKVLFNPHFKADEMSITEERAAILLDKSRFIHSHLPKFLQRKVVKDSESKSPKMKFDNGSEIAGLAASKNPGRGDTAGLVLWDEAAFSEYGEAVYNSLEPSCIKGQFIVQSTPNGVGGQYHDMWTDEEGGWGKLEIGWRQHPDRDEKWAKETGWKSADAKKARHFASQYDCDFVGSSMNYFDINVVNEMLKKVVDPIADIDGLKIYEEPVKWEKYAIGVDVADSVIKGDYSSFHVLAKSNNSVVACFRKRVLSEKLATRIIEACHMYNRGLIGVERNNHGHKVLEILKRANMPLYNQKTFDHRTRKNTYKIGWLTNKATKPQMLDDLDGDIRNYTIGIPDKKTLQELSTFGYLMDNEKSKTEKTGAMGSKSHDDTVISLAIAKQVSLDMRKPMSPEEKENIKRRKPVNKRFFRFKRAKY